MKKILNKLISILLISAFLIFIGLGAFFISSISNIQVNEFSKITSPKYSKIYDSNNRIIEDFEKNDISYIKYEEIPYILVDALISIEDKDFFRHNGINEKRIISSFINNINPNNSTQGASTLTQQLVKNILLTNEKTYKRKVQEAYLAIKLENELSKEEILEYYFNHIYFEQSVPGIQYASRKFFNKDVRNITLPEAALLVGLVKSPSYYYPLTNPERTDKRKNEVLKAMLDNNKITNTQYDLALSFSCDDLLVKDSTNEESYQFQAYLDVVYKEVKDLTGLDVFNTPLKIETYIDAYLQKLIDEIQEGNHVSISNNNQQIGGTVLDKDGHIIGVLGGRNYKGKKIFNHAYDLKTSPASTIKPIFSYALGVEHLHYSTLTTIEDKEYYYPGTHTLVHNADKSYLGKIPLIDALGYSRNTCAISTLEKVIQKIGLNNVEEYLKDINMMDQGPFTYAYGIGGMKYGVSPIQVSGAYNMLLNDGKFNYPTTIKRITSLEDHNIIYEHKLENKQMISEESADIITNTLERIVDNNYLGMNIAKPIGITIAGKTGTNGYSKQLINKYNLPSNADKDIWFSGYSPSYTISIWSGFTKINEEGKSYFSTSQDKKVPKLIFKKLMERVSQKNNKFTLSDKLTKVYVVKGLDKDYLPNELTPSSYISFSYYKKEDIPSLKLPDPILNKISAINGVLYENTIHFSILDNLIKDEIYSTFYGEKGYLISIYFDSVLIDTFFTTSPSFEVPLGMNGTYEIEVIETFKNNYKIKGDPYRTTYSFE